MITHRLSGWSMSRCWTTRMGSGAAERLRAWLVTGPAGRGIAFAIDFSVALRTMLAQRRAR
jgi:hypothetical protein